MSSEGDLPRRWGAARSGTGRSSPPWVHSRLRLTASTLLVVAGACAVSSAFTPWWTFSLNAPPYTENLSFFPGSDATAHATNNSQSASASGSYHSVGLGAFAALYFAVWAVLLVAGGGILVGGALALLAEFRLIKGFARGYLPAALGLVLVLLPLVMVIAVPVTQPGIFTYSDPFGICPQGFYANLAPTPCNSFWGSQSGQGVSVSWGAGVGWYLAVVSMVLSLVGGVLWRWALYHPWSRDEDPFGRGLLSTPIAGSQSAVAGSPIPPTLQSPGWPPATPGRLSVGDVHPPSKLDAATQQVNSQFPALRPGGGDLVRPSLATAPRPAARSAPTPSNARGLLGPASQLVEWTGAVSLGTITREQFESKKARLLANLSRVSTDLRLPPSGLAVELAGLAKLQREGWVTHPEYLALREAIMQTSQRTGPSSSP